MNFAQKLLSMFTVAIISLDKSGQKGLADW
jgi:hypothetical protein